MTASKHCMNCVYVIIPQHETLQCSHPECGELDPEIDDWVCHTTGYARSPAGKCGNEAKLYQEPKR
jgi:hypothetical protein